MVALVFDASKYVREICLAGQGVRCCRYLLGELDGSMHCGKFSTLRGYLDRRVAEQSLVAQGDNCAGRPQEETL